MRKNAMTDASDAQWATAVARERVVRFLAAQSPIRRSDIDAAAEELHLSRAMLYRLLARYRRDPHTAALVVGSPGRKTGSQLCTAHSGRHDGRCPGCWESGSVLLAPWPLGDPR
jgi:hypothetical protein